MNPIRPPPSSTSQWGRTKAILGAITTVLIVAGLLWLSFALRAVALLLVLSILFAYLLAPLVALLETPFRWRRKDRSVSRGWAIAIVYLSGFLFIGGSIYLIVPRIAHQLGALDEQSPLVLARQHDWAESLIATYRSYHLPIAVRSAIDQAIYHARDSVDASIREGLVEAAGLVRFLPWIVLIPVISVFLLKDAMGFQNSVLSLLPQGRVRWRGREFFEDVNQTIAFYVRAQLIACLFIGVVCTIGFFIIRVPYALLLGVFAGCLEMIPLVGPLTTALAAGLIAGSNSPEVAIYTVGFLVVLRILHDNVVYPRLIASGIKLHPLAVILALLCGAQLAGMIGLFLAIPITAFLSVSYRHLSKQWNGEEGLLAELLHAREPEPLPVPPVRAAAEIPTPRTFDAMPLAGVRVLAVDDDDDGRALLAGLLERQGAEVSTAGSVAQALETMAGARFDVLLSDIGMPGEDGFELIRRVRALRIEDGGDIPAAALTGYNTAEDRARASTAGFHLHLGKPIDAGELLRTVAALARTGKARHARG